MSRNIAVFLYPGCIFFEIALAVELLAPHHDIEYFTPDGMAHKASNGTVISSKGNYQSALAAQPVAVLIPGGDPALILAENSSVFELLPALSSKGSLIAGICAGNLVMAATGILRGHRGTHNYTEEYADVGKVKFVQPYWAEMTYVLADVVQDGNLITAQPWAYREFAASVARTIGVLTESQAASLTSYFQRMSLGVA